MKRVHVISGRGVPLRRSDVDTDQIIPAEWLKRVERTGFGEGLFSEWRERSDFVLNQDRFRDAKILVAGPNFGTGSSREHAVWALMDQGFRAVIGPSFADIFRGNALKNGLLPIAIPAEAHARLAAAEDASVTVDLQAQEVALPDRTHVRFTVDPFARHCLLEGIDEMEFLLSQESAIAAYERTHEEPSGRGTSQGRT